MPSKDSKDSNTKYKKVFYCKTCSKIPEYVYINEIVSFRRWAKFTSTDTDFEYPLDYGDLDNEIDSSPAGDPPRCYGCNEDVELLKVEKKACVKCGKAKPCIDKEGRPSELPDKWLILSRFDRKIIVCNKCGKCPECHEPSIEIIEGGKLCNNCRQLDLQLDDKVKNRTNKIDTPPYTIEELEELTNENT